MNAATQVRNLIALHKFNEAIIYAAEHMVIAPPHDKKVKDCAHMLKIGKSDPTKIANARRILVMITAPIKLNLTGPKIPKGSPVRLIDKGYRLKKIKNKFDSMGNPWIYRVVNTAGTVFYLRRVIINTNAPHLTQHGEMREENRVYYSKMIEIDGEIYITINITIDRSKCAKYGIDLNNVALEHLQIKDRFELTLEGLRTALVSRLESVSAYYYTAADEPDQNHVEILRSDIVDAYPEVV